MKNIFRVFILLCYNSVAYSQNDIISTNPTAKEPGKTIPVNYENHHHYAVIAGGSKGIGYAIAEALAKRGYNLLLIARHMDSLVSAKRKLENAYHINVEI